ncbi:hypothetical protein NMG60_11000940, partial [Bertholletia excelsa]
MQILAYTDDFLRRLSFKRLRDRKSYQPSSSSSSSSSPPRGFSLSPSFFINGLSRKSMSYNKLPQQPFKLTICKLDGSSFDIVVSRTATVAELKKAVEHVFSNMPTKGPGHISWPHLWGHFCLCYDGWKLTIDSEPISNYRINDGDQLHFVRHVSVHYNLIKKRSKNGSSLEEPRMSEGLIELEASEEKDNSDDQENSEGSDGNQNGITGYKLKLAQLSGGWFSFCRTENPESKFQRKSFSSKMDR